MSAREIMARIAREAATPGFDGFGTIDPAKEALAAYAREKAAKRGDAPMPEGGLFDDTARLQGDLFG